jgi:hypothetical protein
MSITIVDINFKGESESEWGTVLITRDSESGFTNKLMPNAFTHFRYYTGASGIVIALPKL